MLLVKICLCCVLNDYTKCRIICTVDVISPVPLSFIVSSTFKIALYITKTTLIKDKWTQNGKSLSGTLTMNRVF